MNTNIIHAINNLITNPIIGLKAYYKSKTRANNMGDALEEYVKDLFANTMEVEDQIVRLNTISETFSYLGNQNNPPDCILRL